MMRQDGKCELVAYNLKTTDTLFTKLKDQANRTERKEMVYKIPCTQCSLVYIGESRQKISTRLKQHAYTCRRPQATDTALSLHAKTLHHTLNFDGFSCLGVETNDKKRKILEAIHIIKEKEKSMNFKSDTESLGTVYNYLIRKM